MTKKTRPRKRFTLLLIAVIFAVMGLTSCDGEADHYYAMFGPVTPGDDGPSCATYCVATEKTITDGFFEVSRGDVVRFVNLTSGSVNVKLTYTYPDGTASTDSFSLGRGKSKKKTIRQNLPTGGTQIEFEYDTGAPPAQGGPSMVVRP